MSYSYTPRWLIKLDDNKYLCYIVEHWPLLSRARCVYDLLRMLKPLNSKKWWRYNKMYKDVLLSEKTRDEKAREIERIAREICRELGITLVYS
jgi:hypothetical protein